MSKIVRINGLYFASTNGLLFTIFLAVPLLSEYLTATKSHIPGTGIDVLLYKPFNFAYVVIVGFMFVGLNVYFSAKEKLPIWYGVIIGFALLIMWFVFAFLAVVQLHLSLGGKL